MASEKESSSIYLLFVIHLNRSSDLAINTKSINHKCGNCVFCECFTKTMIHKSGKAHSVNGVRSEQQIDTLLVNLLFGNGVTKLTRWCNVSSTHSISVNVNRQNDSNSLRPRSTLTCYALSLCPVNIFCIEYNEPVRPRQEGLQCDGRGSSGIEHVILQFLKML